jgi:ABC-2 type transport system permease protein
MTAPPLTTQPTPEDTSLAGRLRWTISDGLTLIGRELHRLRSGPALLLGMLLFPGFMVVMFGYVLGSAIKVPGGGNYREYLLPGLFAMVTFTSLTTITARVASDASRGVMDRFRSMPMARSAVPFGHTSSDLFGGAIGLVIMALAGLLTGWSPHRGVVPTAEAFGLMLLLRYALTWFGCYLGMLVKNEETVGQFMPLILPLTMLSNAFVPTAGMPAWLRFIANWNPISAMTEANRHLFGNPGGTASGGAWPIAHPVTAVLLWSIAIFVVFAPLATRTYRRRGR